MDSWPSLVLLLLLMVINPSCGGVSMIRNSGPMAPEHTGLYSPEFLQKISQIKAKYRSGKYDLGLNDLLAIDDGKLNQVEVAFKRNLMGVIYFSKKKFEQAVYHFELAQSQAAQDPSLFAQVKLNLASSYYRLGQAQKAFTTLEESSPGMLMPDEAKKYNQLYVKLAKDLGHANAEAEALAGSLVEVKDLEAIKAANEFGQLKVALQRMSLRERSLFFERLYHRNKILAGHLGLLELEKSYYDQTRDDADNLLSWLESNFSDVPLINDQVVAFKERMENVGKIDNLSIGLALPLSGKKRGFAERALYGLDSAKNEYFKKNPGVRPYKIVIKDTEGSSAVGPFRVRELIEQHRVSAVIGGLFPDEATKEYLEAKKYGVLFISLSQVYLPKEQKDHLLIEIPGSIESQLEKVFSKEMLTKFGKRAAIFYPEDQMGQSYLEEFWRRAKENDVSVSAVRSFERSTTDFREQVKQVVGLKFRRERQEEFDVLNELYSLEKSSNMRRVNTLRPQIDFDWIFVPAFPKESLQIIPTFAYFDATRINFIGGPSWRSQSLAKEAQKWGEIYFVGDDIDPEDPKDAGFLNNFTGLFGRRPKLIEMSAYDAFNLVNRILYGQNFSSRQDLNSFLRSGRNPLQGLTGLWTLENGIWIKSMTALKLRRGKVDKLF